MLLPFFNPRNDLDCSSTAIECKIGRTASLEVGHVAGAVSLFGFPQFDAQFVFAAECRAAGAGQPNH